MKLGYLFQICLGFILVMLLVPLKSGGQERIEAGLFLGGSYYLGDLNPNRHFYQTRPAFGSLVRVVLNPRLAFRGTLSTYELSGDYPRSDLSFPEATGRSGSHYQFGRTVADIATQLEINLFDYAHPFREEETRLTPYVTGGLGYMIYRRYYDGSTNDSENPQFILSLPFGLGMKWKLSDWLHVGVEWNFRKTFVDDIDKMGSGAIDPSDPYGFDESSDWHNNDWYSFAGFFVAIDLFQQNVPCNAGY